MTRAAAKRNDDWAGMAGNAVLGFLGHWIGHGLLVAVTHPLQSTMALVLTTGIAYGATNALFLQTARHPAPLFMETASIARPVEAVPAPAIRPAKRAVEPKPVEPAPVIPAATTEAPAPTVSEPIGNKDVADLQTRLAELGFFAGKVDGYYGPQTADAIRRFETAAGLSPVGAATAEALDAARAYRPAPSPTPLADAEPVVPEPATTVAAESAPEPLAPEDDPIGRLVASVALGAAEEAAPAAAAPETKKTLPPAVDPDLVRMVQTGLSRLGFLHVAVSGTFDAETARAIREFENYNNYQVTGALTSDLVDVLMANGAFN